ncbi:SusC/RagA family TonB-linked outer membrane protein [Rufibacter tibetensis]|uniref:TonB-dependent receptor plug domain-containing protein n=1 Tax=Rufibacter tibetensis TaxID=512763 RepID=A0A0P0CSE6_9BACT|nr:TonB-dependent receptor [Rufibacter tibetensis]ALI99425.1 hypothetical protein DC20_11175 [Rufibacter tibetensis]
MKKALLFSFVLVLTLFTQAWAQSRTVTGRVTDAATGEGMPGVTVQLKGSTTASPTDVNGAYSISVPNAGGTLVFSFIGYSNQEIAVGNQSTVNVRLATDARQISEVVVTGYGVQEKREVTGSIAQVSGASIQNQPIASLDKALQGRAAGVVVQSSNGIPGGSVNVQIRGVGSVNGGTQPLYIVDGVQINTGATRSGVTSANPLAGINTNDIESIEVIKDAATAAVYGSQAANGVVIITTKKGKAGRTNFTANYYTGLAERLKKFDVLNSQQYYALRTEAVTNANNPAGARGIVLNEIGLPANATDAQIAALPTYDWQDEAFQRGVVNNYELSARGGNEKTTFYLSGAYQEQSAILSKADFRRASARLNLDHAATDNLSFSTTLNLSNVTQEAPFATSGSFLGNPAFATSLILPSNPIRNEDGTYYGLPGSGQVFRGILNQNVAAVNEFNSGSQRTTGVLGSFAVNYKILPGLSFRSSYSLDYNSIDGEQYRDPRTPDAFVVRGRGFRTVDWLTNFQSVQLLTFARTFADVHKIEAQTGLEYRRDVRSNVFANVSGFPTPEFRTLGSASTPVSVGEGFTGYKRAGAFGSINYVFNGKYTLRAIMSYNGSSRFGKDTQYGFFPGVAAAWNVADENFMADVDWVSSLKLRASWGKNGRDGSGGGGIGNFDARALYGNAGLYAGALGIAQTNLANPVLQWETRTMTDVGIDFAFFGNRVSGTIGGFFEKNDDLLFSLPLQLTTGYSTVTVNVGALEQKGAEFELNTINIDKGDFQWRTNFNYGFVKNEITRLYNDVENTPSYSLIVGEDLGVIYSYEYAGVNPATGRPMWLDKDNNPTYQVAAADRRVIGSTLPRHTGGLENTFSYKGFDFTFLFQYQYGRTEFDGQYGFLAENGNRTFNSLTDLYNRRWTTPGQITDVPRPYNGGTESQGSNHAIASTRNYFKTDYIRLKNMQLGYNFSSSLLARTKVFSSARMYVQATNLYTYTDFPGYDPEFYGVATGIIPQSKNVTFGVQLGF